MAVLWGLLCVTAAVCCLADAYVSPGNNNDVSEGGPQPEFIIRFPKTTEIGCFNGAEPPPGVKGVFFLLDIMLSHDHTCKFLTYNMRDYRGNTDAYRFRRLIAMYPDIVRPGRKLHCSDSSEEDDEWEFEMQRDGVRRRCRMVADPSTRADLSQLRLQEQYKALPGGVLLLRAWYDLPAQTRYRRSPQVSKVQEAARRHDSTARRQAEIAAAARRRKLQGGRG